MAKLPRLPPTAEHRFLKLVCGLPRGVQRRVFGVPPEMDGQRLASDIHALVQIAKLARSDSLSEGLAVEEARVERQREAEVVCGPEPIPMAMVEAVQIPGPAGTLAGRLYVPPGQAPEGLLVYFHGGGWVIGDLETHDGPCRFLAANAGVQVLAVDYRLAPEHPFPAAAEDARAAYSWASANASRLGVALERIGVGGDSAGANLAAVACLLARDEGVAPPAMQLLIYPVTTTEDMPSRRTFGEGFILTKRDMDWFEDRYLPPGTDRGDPRVSVLQADDLSGLPPAYIATAGFDPLRDEGEAYALRMREAGVRVTLRRHAGLVHTYANLTAICPSARQAMLEATAALRAGLAG